MKKEDILAAVDNPHELETFYRENPPEFARLFPEILKSAPASSLLQAWQERLFFDTEYHPEVAADGPKDNAAAIGITIGLSLLAGTLLKFPRFTSLDETAYYSRNSAFIVIMAIVAYFIISDKSRRHVFWRVTIPALVGIVFLNCLPHTTSSQTILLSYLHMPFFFWSLLGVSFMGTQWRNCQRRIDYIRYNGELVIFTTLILIGGMVLTGITMALFTLIKVEMSEWYMANVVVYGTAAAPIVGTLLIDRYIGRRIKIAPLLAKIFAPLFLITVVAYLGAIVFMQKSPYTDREFLITFNGLLLLVLGLSILAIAERKQHDRINLSDLVNIGLVAITLIIDLIALSAIVFRLSSYGFSPNRIAVLGANIIAFCHLAGILHIYIRALRAKAPLAKLEQWIAGYLPAYTCWSVFVAIGLPIIYWFK